MILKLAKGCTALLLLSFVVIILRWSYVQNEIQNRPIELTDFADSGYTPRGIFGHGDVILKGGELGWYVYDVPAEDGRVKKVCASGELPSPDADFDFFLL